MALGEGIPLGSPIINQHRAVIDFIRQAAQAAPGPIRDAILALLVEAEAELARLRQLAGLP